LFEAGNLTLKQEVESISYNRGWIRAMMRQRAEIFDIGRDQSRANAGVTISPWYSMERIETRSYDKKFKYIWP